MSNETLSPQEKIRQVCNCLIRPIETQYLSLLVEATWIDLALAAGAITKVEEFYYPTENAPLVFTANRNSNAVTVKAPEVIIQLDLPSSFPAPEALPPQAIPHAFNHLLQANNHYFYTCGFVEKLPDPTPQKAVEAVFGFSTQSVSSAQKQVDSFLLVRSSQEKLNAQIKRELVEIEKRNPQENKPQPFPMLQNLKLVNIDRGLARWLSKLCR